MSDAPQRRSLLARQREELDAAEAARGVRRGRDEFEADSRYSDEDEMEDDPAVVEQAAAFVDAQPIQLPTPPPQMQIGANMGNAQQFNLGLRGIRSLCSRQQTHPHSPRLIHLIHS